MSALAQAAKSLPLKEFASAVLAPVFLEIDGCA